MRKATFIGLILIGLMGNRCKKGTTKGTAVLPTDTLIGEVVLEGDTSNPNYRLHYISLNFRVDPDGNLWIADLGGHRLLKYNPEGKYQNQVIFYPESTIISEESPKIDVSKITCSLAPVHIQDFSFDRDGNLYAFFRKKDFLSNTWKEKLVVVKRDKIIHTYDLKLDKNEDVLPKSIAIDSKKHIYIARGAIAARAACPDFKSILIIDSVGNKLGTMGTPLTRRDWNPAELSHGNKMCLAIDKEDNLWGAFVFQPIVRKYNSKRHLLWKRKYLIAEVRKALASSDSAHREILQKRDRRRSRFFETFCGIQPLPDGGALLFTCKGVAYQLNGKGDICCKMFLKGNRHGRRPFYAFDDKRGYIYEYIRFPVNKLEKKISGITIYRYKFDSKEKRR